MKDPSDSIPDQAETGKSSQSGFSLIELLIAVVILGVGIIGVVFLLPQSYNHIGSAGRLSAMNHLAQKKLDLLRSLGYSDPSLTNGTHPTVPERITYVTDANGNNVYEDYTIRWFVQDGAPETNMKTITIEVGHQLFDSSNVLIDSSKAINQKVIKVQTYMTQ